MDGEEETRSARQFINLEVDEEETRLFNLIIEKDIKTHHLHDEINHLRVESNCAKYKMQECNRKFMELEYDLQQSLSELDKMKNSLFDHRKSRIPDVLVVTGRKFNVNIPL